MTVGDRIRQVRIEKDITQQELADCAGVSKQAVYKYENNIVTNIPMDKLSLIASKLGVTPCFLMGWEDNNSVPEVPDTKPPSSRRAARWLRDYGAVCESSGRQAAGGFELSALPVSERR